MAFVIGYLSLGIVYSVVSALLRAARAVRFHQRVYWPSVAFGAVLGAFLWPWLAYEDGVSRAQAWYYRRLY